MNTLRRLALLKPVHHAQRHFTNPKALPQISLRTSTYTEPAGPAAPVLSDDADVSSEAAESADFAVDPDPAECALSNPYYATLLNSKLDACPPQPFNEPTNIVWGAVYDT